MPVVIWQETSSTDVIYADDRYYRMLSTAQQEAVHKLETSARKLHLKNWRRSAKYMKMTNRYCRLSATYKEAGSHKFQTVHSFSCLGSGNKLKNDMSVEIKKSILFASKCFHGPQRLLKSHLTLRKKKNKPVLHNVLTRRLVTYGGIGSGGAVGWGTALQAARLRFRFPARSSGFFIDLILPAALKAIKYKPNITYLSADAQPSK